MLRRYVSLNRGSLDDGAEIKEFLVGVGYEVIEVGRQLKRVDGLVIVRFEHKRDVSAVVDNPSEISGAFSSYLGQTIVLGCVNPALGTYL